MPVQQIVCISIDGLRASALGAYGNTWHGTPALDALAAQSQVFDWMICDWPTEAGFFQSVWMGGPPPLQGGVRGGIDPVSAYPDAASDDQDTSPNLSPPGRGTMPEQLAAHGVVTSLVTDRLVVAELAEAVGFDEIRRIDFRSDQSAETIADTELAQLFAVAIDQLASWSETPAGASGPTTRRLLWLHARGYRGAWDAPAEYRDSLLEDEDPAAPTFVAPPAREAVSDHDALLQYRTAYAAQTLVLDECVAALVAATDEFGLAENAAIVLIGTRGFALGEHGVVGGGADALYSELLHVPCLVRLPGVESPPPRWASLLQPADLYGVLKSAFELGDDGPRAALPIRQLVVASNEVGERALRTPAWLLRQPARGEPGTPQGARSGTGEAAQLYVKPDDRWEANEIASLMPDVTSRLLAVLEAARDGDGSGSAALDDDLVAHAR